MREDSVTWDEILKLANVLESKLLRGHFDGACALHLARAVLVFNRQIRVGFRVTHLPTLHESNATRIDEQRGRRRDAGVPVDAAPSAHVPPIAHT